MNTAELETHQMPKAIVNWLYAEFLNGKNPAVADELISREFVNASGKGPQAFKSGVLPLLQAFPDVQFKIEDMVVEDSRVVVRWTWKGTHRGAFAGIAPTDREVTNDGIAIYRVEKGKIVETWAQMDRLGVLQQLGVVPPLGRPVPATPKES